MGGTADEREDSAREVAITSEPPSADKIAFGVLGCGGTVRYFVTLLLALAGASTYLSAFPLFGLQSGEEKFEVVSIKENTSGDLSIRAEPQPPDGYRRTSLPVESYVTFAFGISQDSRIANLPDWTSTTRFDINAKAAGPITSEQRRAMLRDVLVSRFKLRTHVEQREQTVYVMTSVRPDKRLGPGLKLRDDCADQPCLSAGTGTPQGVKMQATGLTQFADGILSNVLGQVVRDETGVTGVFDIEATWRPDTGQVDPGDSRPDVFTALRDQLGLKLEPQKRPVEVLVIDHIERPTEN
jgi:uncharacterized protein (TIGR03435 family)